VHGLPTSIAAKVPRTMRCFTLILILILITVVIAEGVAHRAAQVESFLIKTYCKGIDEGRAVDQVFVDEILGAGARTPP
jgi:hypothetical protein